jgi:hypothetical protein
MRGINELMEWELAEETDVLGETVPIVTLPTTYPTWTDLALNTARLW